MEAKKKASVLKAKTPYERVLIPKLSILRLRFAVAVVMHRSPCEMTMFSASVTVLSFTVKGSDIEVSAKSKGAFSLSSLAGGFVRVHRASVMDSSVSIAVSTRLGEVEASLRMTS
ncbi:predicted protein [Coccidioides posadasii str. Silveira]|uniref:Predicted protein n=1 Tax=Coccidioides posadasii (strain RMSCC 757 / Silveira) TaxID=443226 RepID=E9DHK2_COCPS|nr:predicted protein [Coccidioides posadasii str. Silveira]